MIVWHNRSVDEVLKDLDTDIENGLSVSEAEQRLSKYGQNEVIEQGRKKTWKILIEQFTSTLVLILIVAAFISGFLGKPTETSAILVIVILFAVLGFLQEYRAEKALVALKKLTVPLVKVRRNGSITEIPAKYLVSGDVLKLETGDLVPADVRILESHNLRIQEAALTGESNPVDKDNKTLIEVNIPLGDRRNMAYMGTQVTYGRGIAVIIATGMQTEIGKIATLIQEVKTEQTPLQRRMNQVGKTLAVAGIIVAALIFLIGVLSGESLSDMFLTAVSVAVAVVPEGLPAVLTATLALGAQRMLKRKALIRKLHAVETLGSVTVICSDKTGTLTENRMTVTVIDVAGRTLELTNMNHFPAPVTPTPCDSHFLDSNPMSVCMVLAGGALCNDATLKDIPQSDHPETLGDPTEGALLVAASNIGLKQKELQKALPRVTELPFDSERKRMTTVHQVPENRELLPPVLRAIKYTEFPFPYVAITKGAVDGILNQSRLIWIEDRIEKITDAWRKQILDSNDQMAQKGMRVLGIALRGLKKVPTGKRLENLEQNLVFLGLIGMVDPPRPEVKLAVKTCREAGIRPIMITGDHPLTAKFIAHDLGISEKGNYITGQKLDQMSDSELSDELENVSIFARVSPEHKLKIVKALQQKGEIVAMTGDGVNDSPALKRADIGVAMGISGTDVAKEASEMVLLDDNFSTIVAAVEEGRVIYDNIRRFIKFSIAGNIGKVLVMLFAPFCHIIVALQPLQLLWLNLLTDGLLGLGLGLEPAEKYTMKRPPRSPHTSIFKEVLGINVLWIGFMIGIIALAIGCRYYNIAPSGDKTWQTMIFTSIAFMQVGQALAFRSMHSSRFNFSPRSNPMMTVTLLSTLALQLIVIYSPLFYNIFNVTPLSIVDLLVCILSGIFVYSVVKVEKLIDWKKKEKPRSIQ